MKGIILMFLIVYLIELGTCKVDINIDQYMKTKTGQSLASPDPAKCLNRPKDINFKGHHYFLSSNHVEVNKTLGWLECRNICREYCMELVSIESQEENDLITEWFKEKSIPYIWTSGHVCDFPGCSRKSEMFPPKINGWFWVSNMERIPATDKIAQKWNSIPWSKTGYFKKNQPDDAEYLINGNHESCLAILHNVYDDGVKWHDVACYHQKPFICEDSDQLLREINSPKNRGKFF